MMPGPITMDQALVFSIGPDTYALPIGTVRDVVPMATLTPVPRSRKGVAGFFNLRGRPVLALDLAARLDRPADPPSFLVVLEISGEQVALVIGDVRETRRVGIEDREPLPPSASADLTRLSNGLLRVGSGLAVSIDASRLVDLFRLTDTVDA